MTPNFTLSEFVASEKAARAGIDNTLPAILYAPARQTLEMLERIRAELCRFAGRPVPIIISSGYRSMALNAAVGSKPTSDHVHARAVDFIAPAFGSPYQVAKYLTPLVGQLGIGQLINEFPPTGWVHVATRVPPKAVDRIITINAAGTTAGVQTA